MSLTSMDFNLSQLSTSASALLSEEDPLTSEDGTIAQALIASVPQEVYVNAVASRVASI